jgi:hypothetical protein
MVAISKETVDEPIKLRIERDADNKNVVILSRSDLLQIFEELLSEISQKDMKALANYINQTIRPK